MASWLVHLTLDQVVWVQALARDIVLCFEQYNLLSHSECLSLPRCIFMLFAGWEVHIVKNCTRVLKMLPEAKVSIFKSEVSVFHYTARP